MGFFSGEKWEFSPRNLTMKSINPTCSEPTKVEKYLEKNTLVFFKQEKSPKDQNFALY